MKITIVSRPYPPSTPQIILENEAKLRAGAEFVPGILRRVAKRYQNLLIQSVLFKGKLQDLTVLVIPMDNVPEGARTTGTYTTVRKGSSRCGMIRLDVNISDSPKFIALVFAHELSHLLMDVQLDRCRICDCSEAGCYPGLSCVNRYLPPSPDLFGFGLEESIADAIAMYVVTCCRLSDKPGTYAQYATQWKARQNFAPLLASAFGAPLQGSKYIDEFTEESLPELTQKDSETEEVQEFVHVSIRNLFWYCVVINQFRFIVDDYNHIMGEGAWRTLCDHMDAVQQDIRRFGSVDDFTRIHQEKAEALIVEFARRYQENNQ